MTEESNLCHQNPQDTMFGSEWVMANDVFVSGYEHSAEAGETKPRHLPLLSQEEGMMLGLAAEEYATSPFLGVETNLSEPDRNHTPTKKRMRSDSSRHRGEIVTELGPEEVRWFYKEDKRTWKPFVGHDSLKVEKMYRRYCEQNHDKVDNLPADVNGAEVKDRENKTDLVRADSGEGIPVDLLTLGGSVSAKMTEHEDVCVSVEPVCVRGGLYEVDIREKECYPVYWNREHTNSTPSLTMVLYYHGHRTSYLQ